MLSACKRNLLQKILEVKGVIQLRLFRSNMKLSHGKTVYQIICAGRSGLGDVFFIPSCTQFLMHRELYMFTIFLLL